MPAKRKKPWHSGTYHVSAMRVRQAAWADPFTRCWRCTQTLATCGPNRNGTHKNGKAARWTAGHTVDGEVDGLLLPECSPCAASTGATRSNRMRGARRAAQAPPPPPTSWRW